MKDRAATYDKPEGERSIGATVQAFNAITGDGLMSSEERGWLFMALLKAVRTQQGSYRADNYEDGAAYFALMGEAASAERGNAAKEWPDEERIDVIAQNGNGGEHYPKVGDYLPDQGGHLVGFIDGDGIIMSTEQGINTNYAQTASFVSDLKKRSGHADWRTPEIKILETVWENIDKLDELNLLHDCYWSSSLLAIHNGVWVQDFSDGHQSPRNIRGEYIIRPVRTVKIEQLVSAAKE